MLLAAMRPLLLALLFCSSTLGADWYVAPDGNDAWSGKLPAPNAETTDGPFATLAKARDVIRPLPGARTVHLRGGLYELPQGLKFTSEDSGREYAPVVWQAFEKKSRSSSAGARSRVGSRGATASSKRIWPRRGSRVQLSSNSSLPGSDSNSPDIRTSTRRIRTAVAGPTRMVRCGQCTPIEKGRIATP
jgi:hypothetical protein